MTLSTNVSVNTPMNQTQTTSPTKDCVDQASRAAASMYKTPGWSWWARLPLLGAVLLAGVLISPADADAGACTDDSFSTAASDPDWTCTHSNKTYEYADFHVFKRSNSHSSNTCYDNSKFPTPDGKYTFCKHAGVYTYAVFDWQGPNYAENQIKYTTHIDQFGSRSAAAGECPDDPKCTVAGRIRNQLKTGVKAFYKYSTAKGFPNLVGGDGFQNLDTSNLTSLKEMFRGADKFNGDISAWDTSKVTDMASVFSGASQFNVSINGWNTSKVLTMQNMFYYAKKFNHDLANWDVREVTNMSWMFYNAEAFDGDISGWQVGSVSNMDKMFYTARAFNQDLSGWSVGTVTSRNNFDSATYGWCGTGMTNRGRPADWPPYAASSSCPPEVENFVVLMAPETVIAGEQLTYELVYWNSSDAATTGNTMVLELPVGVTVASGADLSGGVPSGDRRKVTWVDLEVPGGTTRQTGADILIPAQVSASTSPNTLLQAEATITDDGGVAISDTANVTATSQALLQVEMSADTYVLPGGEVTYELVVHNAGKSDTKDGAFSVVWNTEEGISPTSSNDATQCSGVPLVCNWPNFSLLAGETWTQSFKATIENDDSLMGSVVIATARASASNAVHSDESGASTTTGVSGTPELRLKLSSVPQYMVKPGGTAIYTLLLANTGTAASKDLFVALPIPSGTVANIPDGAYCDDMTSNTTCEGSYLSWNVPDLEPNQNASPLVVSVTAPATEGGLILQGQYSGRSQQTDEVVDGFSNQSILQVANKPALKLVATLSKTQFAPNDSLEVLFAYENVGTAKSGSGTLRFSLPPDTSLKSWEAGATCDDATCSAGFTGQVSLLVDGLEPSGEPGSSGSATFAVKIEPDAKTIRGSGSVNPQTQGDFLPTADTTRTAILRVEPALPVPIPYWVLGLLAGLMGWLGYRRLRAA